MINKILGHITQYLKHEYVQIIQLAFFIASISLSYVQNTNIFGVVCIAICSVIKIFRCIYSKNLKNLLVAIMSFYFGYLLTAFQLIFFYNAIKNPNNTENVNQQFYLSMSFIAIRNFNLSQILDIRITSYAEIFVYSASELFILIINTIRTLNNLEFFDNNSCQNCAFVKDCLLLGIATAITISILVLDLFYRIFQKKKQLRKQNKQINMTEKESAQLQDKSQRNRSML